MNHGVNYWCNKMVKYYCINLVERPDRKERVQKIFDDLGIEVEFPVFHKHPDGGMVGCRDSHMKIWAQAPDDTIVVFEDDAKLVATKEKFFEILKEAEELLNDEECEIVGLGGMHINLGLSVSRNLRRGIRATTVCYISTGQILRSMPERFYNGLLHIDHELMVSARCVVVKEPIFEQFDILDTDNVWSNLHIFDTALRLYQVNRARANSDRGINRIASKLSIITLLSNYLTNHL